ncbi:MAG: nitrous oxide reductase accessory protein NosL [Flavobacteriaceae bacterium]|nr:nitrous oxide reductase accessory protein NosL [Flavobacteriaceae bacterium]
MKKGYLTIFTVFLLIFSSCSVEPEKINFGSDACRFCKMTIVDQQHAAQYVTAKGKQFKFDAIECMLNDLEEITTENISTFLVSDYGNPGSMTDATTATYLISEEIKSPMGAFLSAFSSKVKAEEIHKKSGGKLYSWTTIKEKYSVK